MRARNSPVIITKGRDLFYCFLLFLLSEVSTGTWVTFNWFHWKRRVDATFLYLFRSLEIDKYAVTCLWSGQLKCIVTSYLRVTRISLRVSGGPKTCYCCHTIKIKHLDNLNISILSDTKTCMIYPMHARQTLNWTTNNMNTTTLVG